MAIIVGDDVLKWEWDGGVKQRFRKIEAVYGNLDEHQVRIVSNEALEEQSLDGIDVVSYNQVWLELGWLTFKAATEFGVCSFGCISSLIRGSC